MKFNCDNCGKEAETKSSHYRRAKTHCCSRECSAEYMIKRYQEVKNGAT